MTHRNDLVPSDAEAITTASTPAKYYTGLYVGTGGDVVIRTEKGNDVTFTAVPDGSIIPIGCRGVVTTGTTASNMVGFLP